VQWGWELVSWRHGHTESHLPSKHEVLSPNPSTSNNIKQGTSVLNSVCGAPKLYLQRQLCDSSLSCSPSLPFSGPPGKGGACLWSGCRHGLSRWIKYGHQSLTSAQRLGPGVSDVFIVVIIIVVVVCVCAFLQYWGLNSVSCAFYTSA
jgi:hypothetical protein